MGNEVVHAATVVFTDPVESTLQQKMVVNLKANAVGRTLETVPHEVQILEEKVGNGVRWIIKSSSEHAEGVIRFVEQSLASTGKQYTVTREVQRVSEPQVVPTPAVVPTAEVNPNTPVEIPAKQTVERVTE